MSPTSDDPRDVADAQKMGGDRAVVSSAKDAQHANGKAAAKKRVMPGLKLDGDKEVDVENCPLHLLEYMLPGTSLSLFLSLSPYISPCQLIPPSIHKPIYPSLDPHIHLPIHVQD